MAEKGIPACQQQRGYRKSDHPRPQSRAVLARPVRRDAMNVDFRLLPAGKLAIGQHAFFVQAQKSRVGPHETASKDSPREF
jgi:hypothetical protein